MRNKKIHFIITEVLRPPLHQEAIRYISVESRKEKWAFFRKKTHVQNWQQLGGRHSSFQIRWLSMSTKSGGMEVSLVVSSDPVQRDRNAREEHLFTLGLILAGGEWNSHIGRFAPDVWLSYLCGTHKLNTPDFLVRHRNWRTYDGRLLLSC